MPRRRLRILAIITFVVVAVLYYRAGSLDSYADYATKAVTGGGAVLREPDAPPAAPPPPPPPPPPQDLVAQPAAPAKTEPPAKPSSSMLEAVAETTSRVARSTSKPPLPSLLTSSAIRHLAEQVPYGLPAITDDDEVAFEMNEGRLEVEDVPRPTTMSAIHWSSQTEHFPVSSTRQLPSGSSKPMPRIQYKGKMAADQARLLVIREAAIHAWSGYRQKAWMADEIKPVSGKKNNPFNGWGATLVDSLDTLWLMGMMDEFEEAVGAVRKIDFTTSIRNDIPVFETTIRYLGGLVAAYDVSDGKYRVLLDKAVELAEVLMSAFDTPNRMPLMFYYWKPTLASQPHRASNRVVLSEIGSLSVEFTRLAQLTGEPKYYDAIARIMDEFEKWQNHTRVPGMWPTYVDASGCAKPAQMAHSLSMGPQRPLENGGIIIANDPVKVDEKVIKAAEGTLNEQSRAKEAQKNHADGGKTVNDPDAITPDKPDRTKMKQDDDTSEDSRTVGKPAADSADVTKGDAKKSQIAGWSDPFKEGSLDNNKPTNEKALSEIGLGSSKHKRQLDLFTSKSQLDNDTTVLSNNTAHHQELRSPPNSNTPKNRAAGSDACIPQGLASVSKTGSEFFALGGMSDSLYEYLPKEYMLLGGQVEQYRSMYEDSADTAIERLIYRPMTIDDRDILLSGELRLIPMSGSETGEMLETFVAQGSHLACFAGGMFAMGAKLFNRPQDLEIGAKLTNGCVWAYNITATGMMPEMFTALACDSIDDCKWNETAYRHALDPHAEQRTKLPSLVQQTRTAKSALETASDTAERTAPVTSTPTGAMAEPNQELEKRQLGEPSPDAPTKGPDGTHVQAGTPAEQAAAITSLARAIYTPPAPLSHEEYVRKKIGDERLPPGMVAIRSRMYILRPEAIESVWYMYRITGDAYWREVGWTMFTSVQDHTRTVYGNSAIDDVTKEAPELKDTMESFWLAETLKYFYLLFEDGDVFSLDKWVLNTEAHFFKRPPYKFKKVT